MQNFYLTLGSIILFTSAFSQNPIISWEKSFGGSTYEGAYLIRQTSDGGYIVAGYNYSTDGDVAGHHGPTWYPDAWVLKLNSSGDTVWTRSIGGTWDDYASAVVEAPDGGYIVTVQSYSDDGDLSINYGSYDYFIIKLNSTGQTQWKKSLNGTSTDIVNGVVVNPDNTIMLVGYSSSSTNDFAGNKGYSDVWVHKLDSTGNIIWKKNYGGTDDDEGWSIAAAADGGFFITGTTWSNDGDVSGNNGYRDIWVFKINSAGTLLWQNALGGTYYEYGNYVDATNDGGCIVAGLSESDDGDLDTNNGWYDYWVVKLDSIGILQWQKSFGGSVSDYGNSITQTSDGGYMVAGHTKSNDGDVGTNFGKEDIWLLKLDNSGNIQWKEVIGGDSLDYCYSVIQTSDGGYALTAITRSFDNDISANNGEADLWVAKLQCNPPYTPDVCLVTVDSASQKNLIVWEKSGVPAYVESFNIYKEGTMAGSYNLIANVPLAYVSEYLDSASDPKTKANRYKISTMDTCGFESPLSSEHKTMHLTVNVGSSDEINLIWDGYEGFTFYTYNIYAGNSSQMDSIDAMPGTLTSYSIWPPYDSSWTDFIVAVVHPSGCTSTMKIKSYNSSKSNTASLSISSPPLAATITAVNVMCNGNNNGTATVAISSGTPPFTFLWDDPQSQTTNPATGLSAGAYTVTVTDDNDSTLLLSIAITEPPSLQLMVTTVQDTGSASGSATAWVNGGTPGYSYLWTSTGGQTTATATGLNAGTYVILVTDANGCTIADTITVPGDIGFNDLNNLISIGISPNPVAQNSMIQYSTAGRINASIYIENIAGQRVLTIIENLPLSPGTYRTDAGFLLKNLPEGLYCIRFSSDGNILLKKFVLIR